MDSPSRTRTDQLRQQANAGREGARGLLSATLGSNPWDKVEELRVVGARKAEAEGVAYQMEHERHHLLARLASEYAVAHAKENMSEAKLDRMARADQRYIAHIKGTAVAIQNKNLANSEYWAIRSELEWDRAAVAHHNALTRLDDPS